MSTDGLSHQEMSKDQLEDRVSELETHVETLTQTVELLIQIKGADSPEDAKLENLWMVGYPIGKIIDEADYRSKVNKKRLEGGQSGSSAASSVDRSEFLPVYKMWLDVQDNDHGRLGDTHRRAARIFGDFIKRADPSNGVYSYSSGQAKQCLEDSGDVTDGGMSKTTTRAMRAVQRLTKRTDEDIPVVTFDNSRGTNYLVAKRDRWEAEMKKVQEVLVGEPADDDSVGTESEAIPVQCETNQLDQEIDAEEERLFSATLTDNSDNVVSTSESTLSESTEPTQENQTTI